MASGLGLSFGLVQDGSLRGLPVWFLALGPGDPSLELDHPELAALYPTVRMVHHRGTSLDRVLPVQLQLQHKGLFLSQLRFSAFEPPNYELRYQVMDLECGFKAPDIRVNELHYWLLSLKRDWPDPELPPSMRSPAVPKYLHIQSLDSRVFEFLKSSSYSWYISFFGPGGDYR